MEDLQMFLGFDLDGVIVDHSFVKIQLAQKFGFTVNKYQVYPDNLYRLLGPDKYYEFTHCLYDDPQIAMKGVIMRGSKSVLGKLKKRNIRFAVISRRKNNHDIPINLLRKHGLWPDILNRQNVFFVQNRGDKNTKAISLGISHFMDDDWEVLEQLTGVLNKYLFDPYGIAPDCCFKKIVSWREFYELIEGGK